MAEVEKRENWTISELIRWATEYLQSRGVESPRLSVEMMLGRVLACERLNLYLQFDRPLDRGELASFKSLLIRRRNHEPMAYILGVKDFYGMELEVGPGVLIPRPETEHLVEEALARLKDWPAPRVLDLCTGSGAVALAICYESSETKAIGVDISREAIAFASRNSRKLGLEDRVRWLVGDLFQPVGASEGFFEVITANPPYIPHSYWSQLEPQVREYEPRGALLSGAEGLDLISRIIKGASTFLRPQGWLLMEMGLGQSADVMALARATGAYEAIETVNDLAGIPRVLTCQRKDYG